jgi:hypothetical protein
MSGVLRVDNATFPAAPLPTDYEFYGDAEFTASFSTAGIIAITPSFPIAEMVMAWAVCHNAANDSDPPEELAFKSFAPINATRPETEAQFIFMTRNAAGPPGPPPYVQPINPTIVYKVHFTLQFLLTPLQ